MKTRDSLGLITKKKETLPSEIQTVPMLLRKEISNKVPYSYELLNFNNDCHNNNLFLIQ